MGRKNVRKVFPVRSQSIVPPFQAPICTLEDFTKTLEVTLAKLRSAMTAAGAATKPRTDLPPTGISGAT